MARRFLLACTAALLAALTFGGIPAWLATTPWRRGGGADVDVALRPALLLEQDGTLLGRWLVQSD